LPIIVRGDGLPIGRHETGRRKLKQACGSPLFADEISFPFWGCPKTFLGLFDANQMRELALTEQFDNPGGMPTVAGWNVNRFYYPGLTRDGSTTE
jgi:hypothetical protein